MTPIYVECWFIGGPWNNRLVALSDRVARGWFFYVPVPQEGLVIAIKSAPRIRPEDVAVPIVTYRRGAPLPTGVPVFECLWGPY